MGSGAPSGFLARCALLGKRCRVTPILERTWEPKIIEGWVCECVERVARFYMYYGKFASVPRDLPWDEECLNDKDASTKSLYIFVRVTFSYAPI